MSDSRQFNIGQNDRRYNRDQQKRIARLWRSRREDVGDPGDDRRSQTQQW
jgi:hypothetical protein